MFYIHNFCYFMRSLIQIQFNKHAVLIKQTENESKVS